MTSSTQAMPFLTRPTEAHPFRSNEHTGGQPPLILSIRRTFGALVSGFKRLNDRSSICLAGALLITILGAEDTVGVVRNEPGASPGYTLFAPSSSTFTYLVDLEGNLVQRWSSDYTPGNACYLLPDGNLLRAANTGDTTFTAGGAGGRIEEYDWEGTLVWSMDWSDTQKRQHHDGIKLPNGNILFVAWELKSAAEAIGAGRKPSLLADGVLWPDCLIEVEPSGSSGGTIVWEWHAWDHLIQDYDPTKPNYGVVANHPELIDLNFVRNGGADWLHINALDYNAELDQIVLSVPFFNEIWIIDHSTTTAQAATHSGGNSGKGGDLLYRWGNPAAYRGGTASDQTLFFQHNARWIRPGLPGEGRLLIFNNGNGRFAGSYSSIEEIITPVNTGGSYTLPASGQYGPATAEWSYSANPLESFYSPFISGAQRLPNGNTLICDGPGGQFFEVNAAGDELWRYINPVGPGGTSVDQGTAPSTNRAFRAERYPADYSGLAERSLRHHGTVEGNPNATFQVIDTSSEGDDIVIRWNSISDAAYSIHYSPSMDPGTWAEIATVTAIGTEAFFVDQDSARTSQGKGFYRVSDL